MLLNVVVIVVVVAMFFAGSRQSVSHHAQVSAFAFWTIESDGLAQLLRFFWLQNRANDAQAARSARSSKQSLPKLSKLATSVDKMHRLLW